MQGMFCTVRWNSTKPTAAASLAAAATLSAILTSLRFGSNEQKLYNSTTTKVQLKSTESAINT